MKRVLIALASLCVIAQLTTAQTPEATSAPDITPEASPEALPPDSPPDNYSARVEAYFATNNNNPLVGEPFELEIVVNAPPDIEIVQWPTFPEDAQPFDILESGDIITENATESTRYSQTLTAVLWESGSHLTPEISVHFMETGSPAEQQALLSSAFFSVESLLPAGETATLRPAKSPINLPYLPVTVWVGAAAMMGGAGYGVFWWGRKRRHRLFMSGASSAMQTSLSALSDLKFQNLPAEQLYPRIAAHLRSYVQSSLQVRATEMTSSELIEALRQRQFPPRLCHDLQRILEQADLVKFARFQPESTSSLRILKFAINWLEEAERVIAEQNQKDEASD